MRTSLILAALLAAPVSLLAQFRGPEGVPFRSGDVERLNPASIAIDLRKDLRLDQEQLKTLDTLKKAFDRDGKRMADSLRMSQRKITTAPPLLRRPPEGKPETRKDSLQRAKLDSTNRMKRDRYFEEVTTGRRDLAATLLALKDLFDQHLELVRATLTADQRTMASMPLESAAEEFTRRLRLANVR
jgi:hypothetical protein